ncbi:MAG: hypothetical protein V1668_03290 [Patescibacteria group bacterium]
MEKNLDKRSAKAEMRQYRVRMVINVLAIIGFVAIIWASVWILNIPAQNKPSFIFSENIEWANVSLEFFSPVLLQRLHNQADSLKIEVAKQYGLAENRPPGWPEYELRFGIRCQDSIYSMYALAQYFCQCGCDDDSAKFALVICPLATDGFKTDSIKILSYSVMTWQEYIEKITFSERR